MMTKRKNTIQISGYVGAGGEIFDTPTAADKASETWQKTPIAPYGYQFAATADPNTDGTIPIAGDEPLTAAELDAPTATEERLLFRQCRRQLALSAELMARALHVGGGRTIRRWEKGDTAIPGPVWVALYYMMKEASDELEAPPRLYRAISKGPLGVDLD